MRSTFFILLFSFFFQACGFVTEKLNLGSITLLFSRLGQAEISGIAMKGRVMGARVQVLPLVNNACDRTGATRPFAETTTDENGNYAVRYPKNGRPVCVLVTPSDDGRTVMYDETLLRDIGWTEKNFYLDTIVQEPSGPTQAGVVSSPFSRMAARVFAKTMEKADPSFAAAVANASSRQVVSMFGLNKGFVRKEAKGVKSFSYSPNAHPRSFGKRNLPRERLSASRSNSGSARGSRNVSSSVTPTLEELKLDFTKPDDPFVATSIIKLSGLSALANSFANGAARSIQKGLTTRSTANGDALELVIDGFSQVIESGGRRNTILRNVFTQATGQPPPLNFTRNPLEAAMQAGISSFVQNSAGAQAFNLDINEIQSTFNMSSTPPTDLIVDTGSAPDYLYYADNNDEGALVLKTNTFESYYPWVEGGLPTNYEVRSGTLPQGMSLNPVTGELSGTPTTATASSQITIRASNLFGSTSTSFRVRVLTIVEGQPFAFVYNSNCTQNTTCNLDIGIEGIRGNNYRITGFTSTAGTFSVTNGTLGTITGTARNVSGIRKGNLTYTNLNTGASATINDVDFYIDPNRPEAYIWGSELVQGFAFSYVAFEMTGVGDFGTYSFVPQNFGNGMSIDRFGSITGTPTTSGSWSPVIQVITASGQTFSVSLGTLTIGVPGTTPTLVVGDATPASNLVLFYTGTCLENIPNCSLTIDASQTVFPAGLTAANFTFSDTTSELSVYGLSLASNGTITGNPNTFGLIFTNVTATDSNSNTYSVIVQFNVSQQFFPTLSYANAGNPFTFTVGSQIPLIEPTITQTLTSCIASPALPAGLSIDNTTCEISGTPSVQVPTTNYLITAANANGTAIATISITVTSNSPTLVYPNSTFVLSLGNPVTAATGTPSITQTFTTCTSNLALPAGLTINNTTCAIAGTPGNAQSATNYTITGTNANGTVTANISIAVTSPPTLVYPNSTLSLNQNLAMTAVNPTISQPFTTCTASPSLPAGIVIVNTNCAITGTPTISQAATNHTITGTNANGTVTAVVNITVIAEPLYSLYVVDSVNNIIHIFNTGNSGALTANGNLAAGFTNPYTILWNGKHIVANAGNSFRSFLRNPDGSLTFANSYTAANIPVLIQGNTEFHSSGKFFYYTVNTGSSVQSFSKLQMDTNGAFSGEVNTSAGASQNWTVMGPIHPTGNYFMTFHQSSTATRRFWPITDLNTGSLGAGTSDNTVPQTSVYPENAHCIFSLNALYLYCANNSGLGAIGTIGQMSVTSTSNTSISASFVVQNTTAYQSPKSLVLHPSGDYIFAYGNTNIYSYSVDQATGLINGTPISVVPTPGGAGCTANTNLTRLAIHPQGHTLYAACVVSGASNSIGAYPINPATGSLSAPTLTTVPGTTSNINLLFVGN